jgi:hypothetical protein
VSDLGTELINEQKDKNVYSWKQTGSSVKAESSCSNQGRQILLFHISVVRPAYMSQHLSKMDLPQDSGEYSTFTCHQAAMLVSKLHLSSGLVRGLLVLCSWACFQLHFETLLCNGLLFGCSISLSVVTGALDTLLLCLWECIIESYQGRPMGTLSFNLWSALLWCRYLENCCNTVEALTF